MELLMIAALLVQDPKPEEKKKDESPVKVEFKDGLKFKTEDGKFTAHIGGRLLTHVRTVFDRPDSARTSPDTFFVRQARLEMSGTIFKDFEFKVQADFPTGAAANTGTLQDGYVGWRKIPEFGIRIGQQKEPFSQEELCSTRFIDFVERSAFNRQAPGRDIGILFYGDVWEGLFQYELGVFNGQGRSVVDANDEKDLAIRLRVSPFKKSEIEFLQGLRIGIAGTFGDVDSSSTNALDLTTTELAVMFLDATAGTIDGRRTRFGLELSWIYKSFSVRAEWARRSDEVDIGASEDEDIDRDAWYVAITWLVTGEKKPLENRVVPATPLDFENEGFGAVELAFRIAMLEVDEDIFDLGVATAAGNSNEVLTITFGANWYVTRNFRISPNVVFERYDDDVNFGNRTEDSAVGVLLRFQIDF